MPSSIALFLTGAGTGLLAGGASCAAVQGGLLAGAVTRRGSSSSQSPAAPPQSVLEPLGPVGAFLGGKFVSHTILGALLGVFGAALQPSPRAQAVLLLAAGALMLLFALDLFGVKAVGRLVLRPPASFGRAVRQMAKGRSALAPALLGLATVLVPCGVTLSVELIAITSGSPVAGAAVMAGFVLGTAPLFALLGYLFRHSARAFSGRLAIITGVVVLAVGLWTIGSGLQAGGWVSFQPQSAQAAGTADAVRTDASGKQIVTVTVTSVYSPTAITAKAGVPTTLVLHGNGANGCARGFTIPALGVQEIVETDDDTQVDLGTPKAGTLRFTCSMGMVSGNINFQEGGTR
ncbi:sulfite exporter TauE/SafE family protein [Streptomyces sp. NPDC053048]|uniref:urease accessory protein UreH domain-containing protein n=1 Tax=Streptomyces sp. NPDC053048 TaxID=3365694 RepID=UPI0037CF67AF